MPEPRNGIAASPSDLDPLAPVSVFVVGCFILTLFLFFSMINGVFFLHIHYRKKRNSREVEGKREITHDPTS